MEGVQKTVQGYVSGWLNGGSNATLDNSAQTLAPGETYAPADCVAKMEPEVHVFWSLVGAMLVLLIVTILVPWICCCCRHRPRCLAALYTASGLVDVICGSLLATVLLPMCPPGCGEGDTCSKHRYHPTPAYGAVCVCIGMVWFLKSCWLRCCQARKKDREAAVQEDPTSTASFVDHNKMEGEKNGTELTIPEVV